MQASTVISYSSLDNRFIHKTIEQVSIFCNDIIIVYYDKLFNGEEDYINEYNFKNYKNIKLLKLKFTNNNTSRYFHNLARWEGFKKTIYDYILFLDADEIPEGNILKKVLNFNLLKKYDAADFECYWYFRSALNRAKQKEICGLLARRALIKESLMFTDLERWSFRKLSTINYAPQVSIKGQPFLHHYSWVRNKEEMIKKVSSWGHRNDRDWKSLIEEEFSRDFTGKDFVHGYTFTKADNIFDIDL